MATIIAELCQNHNGDKQLLKDMIWAAAEAKADYAKIQSIRASDLSYRERFETGLIENGVTKVIKRPYEPELQRLKSLDLNEDMHHYFIEECGRANIKPLTTAFTRTIIPFLTTLEFDAIKVASYDCASLPLLRELKGKFKHIYISTGAVYDHEIEAAARELAGTSFSFLHCVTIYPTPLSEMHLNRMQFLKKFTPSVGFSDHSLVARDGIKASVAAIALGADVIERHFTILEVDKTKDGPVSITPKHLKELVQFARKPIEEVKDFVAKEIPEAGMMMGQAQRDLSPAELLNRDYYRGRFANKVGEKVVYNWEEQPVL
jgi:N,N'-diacetyllegionaminate synthase